MLNSLFSFLSASENYAPYLELNSSINLKIPVRMLWALGIITFVFTYVNMSQIAPNDFWWHMAVGRDILANGQIPAVDIYSYTMAGQPYLSYQMFWLMDIWLYGWYSLGGAELVLFIQSLVITSTYLIILLLCWRISKKWGVTSFCLLFTIILGIYAWNVRPQAISFLIGAVFLYGIYAYRQQPGLKWLLVFPIGMLVWVNSHGSFPAGLLLLSIWVGDELWRGYLAWRKEKRLILSRLIAPVSVLFVTVGVCILNPRGIGILSYLMTMASNPAVQNTVPEWSPPNFNTPIGPLFFASILFTAVVLARSPRRPTFFQLSCFVTFAALGLWTTRGVVWFGLVTAPILADHIAAFRERGELTDKPRKTQKNLYLVNFGILCLLFCLSLVSLPWLRDLVPMRPDYRSLITRDTPVEAVHFLVDQRPAGRIFNDMAFGSYLIWAAHPQYQVFSDPRIELFSEGIWNDYQEISRAWPGWREKLEDYDVRTLIVNPHEQGALIKGVGESDQWRLIYQDDTAIIYSMVP
jgi:hypothetical protein